MSRSYFYPFRFITLYSSLGLSAIATFSLPAHAATPSSKIPERREYPINPKISACENFYEHTCSKVQESFALRPDRSIHTFSFSDSSERLLEFKKKYFSKLRVKTAKGEREKGIAEYYASCINTKARALEETQQVKSELARLKAFESTSALIQHYADNIDQPEFSWVGFESINNKDNPLTMDLLLQTEFMTLPERSYYEKKEVTDALLDLFTHFFQTIGADHPSARAAALLEFETKFSKIFPTPAEFRELYSSTQRTTKAELLKKYPRFSLERFLAKIPDNTEIRDMIGPTFEFLHKTLAAEPRELLEDIILFHSLSSLMDEGYPEYFKKAFAFRNQHLGGPERRPTLDERCTRAVMGRFTKELDSFLWTRFFPNFDPAKVEQLAERVRASIVTSIQHNEWLSAGARTEAARKISTAPLQVVAPKTDEEWYLMPVMRFGETTFIANTKKYQSAYIDRVFDEIKKGMSSKIWSMGPLTVNAYYSPSHNKFVMPAGILQYPFYDAKLSDTENLGAVGSVVGHELGHSIDDEGSKYDADGRLRSWMKQEDLKRFHEIAAPLKKQYEATGHNGELTLGENIGDLVGVLASYDAAFSSRPQATLEEKKKFFYSYGRTWCSVYRKGIETVLQKTDPHSLGFARANEPVKHLPAFHEAFACKEGDKMYLAPNQRIRIW